MRIGVFTGLIAVVALATAASAAPSLEFSIGLCAGKTNVKARLACYDAIAAQLREGQVPTAAAAPIPTPAPAPAAALAAPVATAPQPAPVAEAPAPVAAAPVAAAPVAAAAAPPPAATPAAPEALFGSEQIAKPERQAAGAPAEVDVIQSTLKSFAYAPTGRVIVTLENGQVWRQIDGDTEQFRGKAGDTITIERAVLGSYNMTISNHTGLFKVHRVH